MIKFIIINITLIFLLTYFSFKNHNNVRKKKNEEIVSFFEFLNRTKKPLEMKTILIGLIFGFLFGFIDNVGLVFGLDNFEHKIHGGTIIKATVGNTYSDGIGAFIGSAISVMAKDYYGYDNEREPVWVNFIGVVIGCLVGVLFAIVYGKYILGKEIRDI